MPGSALPTVAARRRRRRSRPRLLLAACGSDTSSRYTGLRIRLRRRRRHRDPGRGPRSTRSRSSGPPSTTRTSPPWTLRGEVLVVNVWYASCPPCRKEAPDLQAIHEEYPTRECSFVGINVRDSAGPAKAFEENYGITYPSMPDTDAQIMYALRGQVSPNAVPSTLVWTARAVSRRGSPAPPTRRAARDDRHGAGRMILPTDDRRRVPGDSAVRIPAARRSRSPRRPGSWPSCRRACCRWSPAISDMSPGWPVRAPTAARAAGRGPCQAARNGPDARPAVLLFVAGFAVVFMMLGGFAGAAGLPAAGVRRLDQPHRRRDRDPRWAWCSWACSRVCRSNRPGDLASAPTRDCSARPLMGLIFGLSWTPVHRPHLRGDHRAVARDGGDGAVLRGRCSGARVLAGPGDPVRAVRAAVRPRAGVEQEALRAPPHDRAALRARC